MGTSLGIIGGRPATVFIRNEKMIYSRCSTADGSGNWNNITVNSAKFITDVSDPIELNGGIFILMWRDFGETRSVTAATSRDIENPTWNIIGITAVKLRPNSVTSGLTPIVYNGIPQFAIHSHRKEFNNDVLFYYEAQNNIGIGWTSRRYGTYVFINNPTAIVTPNNEVAIYYAFSDDESFIGEFTGQIRNSDGNFVPLASPIIENFYVPDFRFSCNNVNGNVAVAYFISFLPFPFPFNLVYQYSDPSGKNWREPVPIKVLFFPGTSVSLLRLADINNAPCVVTYEIRASGLNNYIYYRGGDPSTFVQDSDVTANYSLN